MCSQRCSPRAQPPSPDRDAGMPVGLSPAQSCLCRDCSPGREDRLKHFLFAWAACSPWLIPGLLPVLMEEAGSCLPTSGLVQSHRHVLAAESQAKECATSGSFSCLDMISCGMDGWCVCGGEGFGCVHWWSRGVAGAGHHVLVPGLVLL